jgi:hypothetical protein
VGIDFNSCLSSIILAECYITHFTPIKITASMYMHFIEMFPEEERVKVLALVEERRLEHSITHRKP